ncbi:MAG: glucose-6-phosphate isomerase, partial [Thermotogota bacterium]
MLNFNFDNFSSEKCVNGHTADEIKSSLEMAQKAFDRLKKDPPGFVQLLGDLSYINSIQQWVEESVKGQYDHFVVLGIGGSALGNIALQKSLRPINWNRMTKSQRGGLPTIDVWDNVDPDFVKSNLEVIDPSKTLFNVISKSGTTAEAMSNYLIVRQMILEKGLSPKEHFVFTTDPEKGVLNKIIDQDGIKKFTIPPSVGGRFSVLTPVGLISAAAAGIDVEQLVKGAADCKNRLFEADVQDNPAAMIALHHMLFGEKGMMINVMFSYSNALYYWADWFRQIWAESLGKATDNDGHSINYGLTPVKAIGPTDQHSQVQLYNDGPNDKVITFLKV